VNLIHLDDCVEIISKIIEHNVTGEIFNVVSDAHPLKRELYTKAASLMGVEAPKFSVYNTTFRKIVSNAKLKKRLNYKFKYPDPQKYLEKSTSCAI